jgi:hypothetical protein
MGTILCTEVRPAESFHLKRVLGRLEPLEPGGEPYSVRLLLNDLNPQGAALFSGKPVAPGLKAKLWLPEPREIVVAGQISWLREFEERRRVFTADPQPFRLGFVFQFGSPEEATQVRALCDELAALFPGADLTKKPFAA